MLLGFKRRFAPMVEDGSKTHTIRGTRKMVPKVGEICHCYVDPRQKTMRLLGRWECLKVEEITIKLNDWIERVDVCIEGIALSADECNSLAWRDGFRTRGYEHAFEEMMEFWQGRLPFTGHVIHWRFTEVPDEPRESIRGRWRKRLAEAERVYREDPTLENRANWKRVRKVFRDLVLGGKKPPPDK
jgi:hypothetical protein